MGGGPNHNNIPLTESNYNRQPSYPQQPYAQQPYSQNPYSQQSYPQQPYPQQPYPQRPYPQHQPQSQSPQLPPKPSQQRDDLAEQSKRRQQFHQRANYNPFLAQTNWSSESSFTSMYPSYDPNEYQLDPVPLLVSPALALPTPPAPQVPQVPPALPPVPVLPPVPTAYKQPSVPPVPTAYQQEPAASTNRVRLIYTKSGFFLKSTNPMADDSIHGFLAIFSKSMENVQPIVAWIPEYLIDPKDIDLFLQLNGDVASEHGFPSIGLNLGQGETMTISLNHIHSLYICPPSIHTQGSIVITSKSGDVLKPIWFSTTTVNDLQSDINGWPGYDIIDILNAFIPLRPGESQHVHLVGNDAIASPVPKSATIETKDPVTKTAIVKEEDPVSKAINNARWTLLERLAKITQYSKEAAQALTQPIALSMQAFSRSKTVNEYQMASHYIARWGNKPEPEYYLMDDTDGLLLGMPELSGPTPIHTRRSPVSPEEWILLFDEEGRLNVPVEHVRQIIFSGGLDSDIRIEAWKFLLGMYTWHSTFDEREAIRRSQKESYYAIKATWFDDTEIRDTTEFKDEKHRIDKDVHRTDREQEAFEGEDLPNPDPAMCVGTNANLEIMKDILVTYNFYNIDLGYVQGMSDILAPLFVAMGDEAMAFWGFCSFMDRVQGNFYVDQTGMHALLNTLKDLIRFMDPTLYQHLEKIQAHEMFFCFRWFLVWFKREFAWDQVIRLWEVLWTNHLSDQFIIFIALAVIDTHRQTMLTEINELDEMLQFFLRLSDDIPLEPTLERAEVLFYQFERKIKAMQHKSALLQDQLQIRAVWNSDQRGLIQERITKLQIPSHILKLLSH